MSALLIVIVLFASYWLVGLGVLAAVRADTAQLRIALVAPALGSAVIDLSLFVLNYDGGLGVSHFAVPVFVVLLAAAAVMLVTRRPRIDPRCLLVVAICLGGLALVAGPLLSYGFNWDSAGNDDMGNYVLSAIQLLHHGLVVPLDINAILHDRDYDTFQQTLHSIGSRPGGDIELAGVSHLFGRVPYEVFMPFILSLALTAACSTGALALQAARRWWGAPIATALILVSPEFAYGWLHQLLGQAAGLAFAPALLALLMDNDLHSGARRPRVGDLVPMGLLTAAFILGYVELASTIAIAYVLYLAIRVAQCRVSIVALARVVIPLAVITVVVLNGYLLRELGYAALQANSGASGTSSGISYFGFSIVPVAFGELAGFEPIPGSGGLIGVNLAIVLGAALVLALLVGSIASARRGRAAAVVLLADAALSVLLARNDSAFGLFKIYMYMQPFMAAILAAWATQIRRRLVLMLTMAGFVLLLILQIPVLRVYVSQSRDPIDLVHASDASLMPAFRHFLATSSAPVVSVTDNPTLAKLEAASMGNRPLYLVTANIFGSLASDERNALVSNDPGNAQAAARAARWQPQSFNLHEPGRSATDPFTINPLGSRVLESGRCQIVLPTGSQLAINRLTLPQGSPQLVREQCDAARDQLIFINSQKGDGYYASGTFPQKTLWQTEPDPFYPGETFSGVGRYLLFQVLGPTTGMRLEFDFSATLLHNSSNALPPAAVVGNRRIALPFVGRGSARVYSKPIQPQLIGGQPYVLIDLGRTGHPLRFPRTGLQGLFGSNVLVDPRFLDGWMRDVSLISAGRYRTLRPPAAISSFPAGLANTSLQYSGIYEDGWVARDSYAILAGGAPTHLVLHALVAKGVGGRLVVLVNGRRVYSRTVAAGLLNVDAAVPASKGPRTVELRFDKTTRLPAPDLRPASARLYYLGFSATG